MWANKEHMDLFVYALEHHFPFMVYDTETTGLAKADYIVQFAGFCMEYDATSHSYKKTDEIDIYIKPPFAMSQEVVEVHGLTNEFLANKPTEQEAFKEIFDFLNRPAVIMGYNVSFDNRMIASMFRRQGKEFDPKSVIDVFKMVKESCIRQELDLPDSKLETVSRNLQLQEGLTFHSALDDVLATWRVAAYLGNRYIYQLKQQQMSNVPKLQGILQKGRLYKRSKYVNRLYCDILCQSKSIRLYYDFFHQAWEEAPGSEGMMQYLDMRYIHEQLLKEAKVQTIETQISKLNKRGKCLTQEEQQAYFDKQMLLDTEVKPSAIYRDFENTTGGNVYAVNFS